MTKMDMDEAVEFAQFIAHKDKVDFESGEGKVVVFKNAVAIMNQSEEHVDKVQMQFIMNDYADVRDIEVEHSMEDIMRGFMGDN